VPYAQLLVAAGASSTACFPYNPMAATTPRAVCAEIDAISVGDPGPDAARLIVGSYKGYTGVRASRRSTLTPSSR
jgi:hypothetical protein